MSKNSAFVFVSLFLALNPSWAQSLEGGGSPAEQAMEKLEEQIKDPESPLQLLGKMVTKVTESQAFETRLQKEIAKYRVRFKVDLMGNLLDGDDASAKTYYMYVVEPAFRNNEQIRKDIWSLDLRLGTGNFSVGGQIRITFSRFFGGPDAKWRAMKAPIYWFWKAPLNSNDVKTKLKNGDGYRFEVSGDIAYGYAKDLTKNDNKSDIFARYKRGGLFIMDLYKINEKLARMRFIGMKNQGELEAGFGATTGLFSDDGFWREALSIGIKANGGMSFDFLKEPLTLNTMMVDYLFNFSSKDTLTQEQLKEAQAESDVEGKGISEAAMEQIFRGLRRGGFASLFLFFYKEKELYKELISKVDITERIARRDLREFEQGRLAFKDLRIYNYFRGTMLSFHRYARLGAKLSGILGGTSQTGTVQSFVTAYDEDYEGSYYWLDNSSLRHTFRALFGRNKYNMQHDLDVLLLSDENRSYGDLADVVVRTQIEDTNISARDMKDYRKIVMGSLPQKYQADDRISSIFKEKEQTNAYLNYRHSFGEAAFIKMKNVSVGEVALKLDEFIENHPERSYMNLPFDAKGDTVSMSQGEWVERKAFEIAAIFDKNATPVQRMRAFRIAKRDPIFERYLVGEFFGRLLPQENPDPFFSFDIRFSSAESGTIALQGIGENKISPIYDAVSFMRSILNDHSLDMQMTSSTDYTGAPVLVPINQDGFLAPLMPMRR